MCCPKTLLIYFFYIYLTNRVKYPIPTIIGLSCKSVNIIVQSNMWKLYLHYLYYEIYSRRHVYGIVHTITVKHKRERKIDPQR